VAFRTEVRGFKPDQRRSDFSGRKKKSSARLPFGREVRLWIPCRRFTACKRSLNSTWKSGIFRLNLPGHFSPHIVPPLVVRISRKTTSGESWKHLNYRVTTSQLSLLRGRGSGELVEKVVRSNTGIVR
jgi:hypothetical protein